MQYDLVAVLPEVTPMAVVAEVSGAPHIGAVASPKENLEQIDRRVELSRQLPLTEWNADQGDDMNDILDALPPSSWKTTVATTLEVLGRIATNSSCTRTVSWML